jgi:Uma2 family endonuclease
VLIVNPIPAAGQRDANEELESWLRNYGEHAPGGHLLDATLPDDCVRTAENRRRADRVIWAGLGRQPDPKRDVPTIVVEFVSAGRRNWKRDYIEKRDEYLALGVAEYWVIDRFRRIMTVYRKAAAGWQEQTIPENEVYRPALLPGFELPLARLVAMANRWTGETRPE